MTTSIKFKILTFIDNSQVEAPVKNILKSHIDTLSDANLAKLITIFEKFPQSITIYAEYLKEIQDQSQALSPGKLEMILSNLMSKLS